MSVPLREHASVQQVQEGALVRCCVPATSWVATCCLLCRAAPSPEHFASPPPSPPRAQVLEFSRNEEGQLVARMMRQSLYGMDVAQRVYPDPKPKAAEPERPPTPALAADAGTPSFA